VNIETLSSIPNSLASIKKPPKSLYYLGDTSLLDKQRISIVGTRKPMQYSRLKIYEISRRLSESGAVIVSGGAMGVDAIAHEGAGQNTIAILANSLDIIYPKVNKNLIEKIYKNSLALSEYPQTSRATKYTFVERNRLVVGLGEILIVAEADENSGSMRSAEIAIKEGKKIYVLPHRLGESKGTLKLLKEGAAKAILDIDAFIEEHGGSLLQKKEDSLMDYFATNPLLNDALKIYGEKVYEYELDGKITIQNSHIKVV